MKEKLKNIMKIIKNTIKDIINDKRKLTILVSIIVIILIICILVSLLMPHNVNDVEKMKIEEVSNESVRYIYNITNDDYSKNEKYILYAIDYYQYEKGNNSLTVDDIISLIKEKFNIELKEEDIIAEGITPEMVNRNVIFDYTNKTYSIDTLSTDMKTIADTKMTFYTIENIKKKGNKYYVKYNEYEITNPYEILNYYNDQTNSYRDNTTVYNDNGEPVTVEAEVEAYDTTDIMDYLNGSKTRSVLYNHITNELLESIGTKKDTITVTYLADNENIYINNIKTE